MNWDWEKLQQKQRERSRNSGSGNGGGNGPQPPSIDDIINRFKNFKLGSSWIVIVVIIVGIVGLLGSSMVYTVETNEVGMVQRFGKFERKTQPGLHFKLPTGIESVTNVRTGRIFTEQFGIETDADAKRNLANESMDVALMLTGDLNVGVVPWIVQYRINDPYKFLFNVADVQSLIRDMAEASMRLIVGDRSINEVISKRHEIAEDSRIKLQKDLDEADTGIFVVTVELGNTNVPQPVQDSFNEVNRAVQQKEEVIYRARQEYNRVIPQARGEAQKTIEGARGYASERINRATGDAARFTSQFEAYAASKDVTRSRLYLEMMENVLPGINEKFIIDSQQQSLLPLLQMGLQKGTINAGQ
jgi:modulator of FtsH protease HflK